MQSKTETLGGTPRNFVNRNVVTSIVASAMQQLVFLLAAGDEVTVDSLLLSIMRVKSDALIQAKIACATCTGLGYRHYPTALTWRPDAAGHEVVVTKDVCDKCWGSGIETQPGTNLIEVLKEGRDYYESC